jgi:hypothetical protein
MRLHKTLNFFAHYFHMTTNVHSTTIFCHFITLRHGPRRTHSHSTVEKACLLMRCLLMDVLLLGAYASAGMCLPSRCLAMGLYVTILSCQLRLGLPSGMNINNKTEIRLRGYVNAKWFEVLRLSGAFTFHSNRQFVFRTVVNMKKTVLWVVTPWISPPSSGSETNPSKKPSESGDICWFRAWPTLRPWRCNRCSSETSGSLSEQRGFRTQKTLIINLQNSLIYLQVSFTRECYLIS